MAVHATIFGIDQAMEIVTACADSTGAVDVAQLIEELQCQQQQQAVQAKVKQAMMVSLFFCLLL